MADMRRIEKLVALALRSLRTIAQNRGADLDDMAQEGRIAGWKADEAWRGGALSWDTYVGRRVLDAMLRYMQGRSGVMRTPRRREAMAAWQDIDSVPEPALGTGDVEPRVIAGIDLAATLGSLSPGERRLALEHHGLGKSHREIAAEAGRGANTVMRQIKHLHRCRARGPGGQTVFTFADGRQTRAVG